MRSVLGVALLASAAWADCLPKVELPKEWLACRADSECVLAGDGCRTCGNWLPVNAKFRAQATKKDAEERAKASCVVTCEACSPEVVALACHQGACTAAAVLQDVGLEELLKSPASFDGKRVRVRGFFGLGPEFAALFASEAELKLQEFARSVWLETEGAPPGLEKLKGKELVVEATFVARRRGGRPGWSGALERVTRATPATKRRGE
ncbi:MAG: hypothetical protein AB1730_07360 [Myxococcota bacterium]|jgi:hypothetical protein